MKSHLKSFNIFLLLTTIGLCGCSPVLSPGVGFNNIGPESIHNIKCSWAGQTLFSLTELEPGQGASQNFWIKQYSDFWGTVNLQWQNASGLSFKKKFQIEDSILVENQVDFDDLNIEFYFTQKNVKHYIEWNGQNSSAYQKRRSQQQKIRVEYKKKVRETQKLSY